MIRTITRYYIQCDHHMRSRSVPVCEARRGPYHTPQTAYIDFEQDRDGWTCEPYGGASAIDRDEGARHFCPQHSVK